VEPARAQLLDQSRRAFTRALSPVTAPEWGWPTGCAGWTVGDLVTHVLGTTAMYTALLEGATAAEAMSRLASVTTSPTSASSDFRQAARAVQARLSNPDVVTGTARHPAGDVTGDGLAGYAMVEWVLHGWDLSRATCRDTVIDSGLARAVYDEILPDAERLRRLGAFGPAIPVPGDAPADVRLVALLGRMPYLIGRMPNLGRRDYWIAAPAGLACAMYGVSGECRGPFAAHQPSLRHPPRLL